MNHPTWKPTGTVGFALILWVATVPLFNSAESALAIPVEVHCTAEGMRASCPAIPESGPCSDAMPDDCPMSATCTVVLTIGGLSMLASDSEHPNVEFSVARISVIPDETAVSRRSRPLVPPPQRS